MNAAAETTRLSRALAEWYSSDTLEEIGGRDRIRRDIEHWERIMRDPTRFPKADLAAIDRFLTAAYPEL